MKYIVFFTAVMLLSAPTTAIERQEGAARVNVLVIGLEREHVSSNYYPDQLIAEKISVPVDSLADYFNRAIVSRLPAESSGPARFIRDDRICTRALPAGTRYEGEEEGVHRDLSRVPRDSLTRLLDAFEADFLLLVSQYYMKQETEPFPYLYHIVNYEVYDRQKTKRYEGYVCFDTPDLLPAPRLDKYYKKIASRIVARVNRVVRE
ncbi:MAG: hypothetical protein LBD64_05335 [Odoribacteraceae bacterium]|nr:hypothetical protein [Odoribacteraceae bacterium]